MVRGGRVSNNGKLAEFTSWPGHAPPSDAEDLLSKVRP